MTGAGGGVVVMGSLKLARALQGVVGGRIERADGTTLEVRRHAGAVVEVAGQLVTLPTAPISVEIPDNLIAADGTDSTLPVQASTLYSVYLSNGSATYRSTGLGLSATAPTVADDGFLYLATSGNGRQWRFVGWVFVNASTAFVDNASDRLVVNYYNRQRRHVRVFPGYVDNNSSTIVSVPVSTVFGLAHPDAQISWVSNGEDSYDVRLVVAQATAGGSASPKAGIGINSVTAAEVATTLVASANDYHYSIGWSAKGAAGELVTASMLSVAGTTAWQYYADLSRVGSVADPRATSLIAVVSV